jgi:uncharacterized membrane protein YcaP (DUF421 family)
MEILDALTGALGIGQEVKDLAAWQLILRAIVVYGFSLLLVKAAKKRFMGKNSALDFVVVVILGSVISRAINGTAPFGPTLAAAIAIVVVHRIVCWFSTRVPAIGRFVEGEAYFLMRNGEIDWRAMRAHDMTKRDLESAVRQQLHADDFSQVECILLEPNGKLSVVKK